MLYVRTYVCAAVNSIVRSSGWVVIIWVGPDGFLYCGTGSCPVCSCVEQMTCVDLCVLCSSVTSWLSLTCPQRPSRRSFTELDESSSHRRIIFKMHFNIILSYTPSCPKWSVPFRFQKVCILRSSLPDDIARQAVCLQESSGCWLAFGVRLMQSDCILIWLVTLLKTLVGKNGHVVKLTSHLYVVSRPRITGGKPTLRLYACVACTWTAFCSVLIC
jgi:hypothetical protein